MSARLQRFWCRLRYHNVIPCSDGWLCLACDKEWDR
jgi:hypothetical protein